ncbi:cobalt transporter CbiM [Morganella morganii]
MHLILNGLAGLFLGWAVFPAFLIALALQVLFFSFGGFAVLGVNLCNISIPALLVYYLFRNSLRPGLSQGRLVYLGVMAGVIGTLGTVCLTSLALVLDSGKSYIDLVWLLFIGHLPIFVTDSLISVGILLALAKMRPASLMVNQPGQHTYG